MSRPKQYFRAGAGAVIINQRGLVLALERADVAGAWQLPQGGLDASEEPLPAAFREVTEETGIGAADLALLDTYPEPLIYELPVRMRTEKTGRGQVQYWYLFRFNGQDGAIDAITGGEFQAWRWTTMDDLLHTTSDFRLSLYRKLADRFDSFLAKPEAD
ncbi:MAG: RNA pyrophosphohydrolase [Desulfobulbaceae bacterium]|nr:RNA pyrophosphohydrolase [Desulfobulbaceae bacterium]